MKSLAGAMLSLCLVAAGTVGAAIPTDALLERLTPAGFVNDFAKVLTPAQREALEQRVRDLQQKTGAELAVVTVTSLEGGQIDDFTHKLFSNWGIGLKGRNNGIMLLVALQDRKMRIEVGYGLEPVLPDVLAGRIIDEDLRPRFRESRYADGLEQAVQRIAAIVERGEPASRQGPAGAGAFPPPGTQFGVAAFLSLFVAIGLFMAGAGMGSKTFFLVLWGLPFGGLPMLLSFAVGRVAPFVLVSVGIAMFVLGLRKGRRSPGAFRGGSGRRGRGAWVWGGSGGGSGGGGGFSGGGGGGFGGGSSGGGGASGSW